MKTIKFVALVSVLALAMSISQSPVFALTGDSSLETDQDATVTKSTGTEVSQDTTAGVNSTVSTEAAQNATAGVRANISAELDQDGPAQGANTTVSNPSGELDQDGSAGVNSNPSTELDQDSFTAMPPVTPPGGGGGPASDGASSNSSGGTSSGSSRSFSSGGSVAQFGTIPQLVVGSIPLPCPLITSYLRLGGTNDAIQVTKLQAFLKGVENMNVDVTGIFDQKTDLAVKTFQEKYSVSVLGPWEASEGSGYVYITTSKKINEIACAAGFTLTPAEQAIIEAFKRNRDTVQSSTTPLFGAGSDNTASTTDVLEFGTNSDGTQNENVAAVGGTSVLSRFWNYIKDLFR